MNGRDLTNRGIVRADLVASFAASEHINHGLTQVVRQFEPGTDGTPVELYAFANQTSWIPYEVIQADIFDHVSAVLAEFGLRAPEPDRSPHTPARGEPGGNTDQRLRRAARSDESGSPVRLPRASESRFSA